MSLSRTSDPVHFVAYEGVAGNDVVKSQVLGLAVELARRGVSCDVVAFERLDRYARGLAEVASISARTSGPQVDVRLVPRLPGAGGVRLSRLVLRWLMRKSRGIIHCRGMKAFAVARNLGSDDRRVVVDFRGAEPEEAMDLRARGVRVESRLVPASDELIFARMNDMERDAASRASHILCVSNSLARHIVAKHDVGMDRVDVVHCGASAAHRFDPVARAAEREALGVSDEFVLCYLGRLSAVHRPDLIASFASSVSRATTAKVVLLVLSPDVDAISRLRESVTGEVRLVAMRVDSLEVPKYLSAADAGLLMLDGAFRNTVSFPVKFSEYACCGLPVFLTPYARDPAEHVRSLGIGAIVQPTEGDDWAVSWPEGTTLSDAILELRGVTGEQRAEWADAAALTMRFDHTASGVLQAYRKARDVVGSRP